MESNESCEQLRQVLATYISRCLDVLGLLEREDFEDALFSAAFRQQKAAFHNFLALEHKFSRSGFLMSEQPELSQLGREASLLSAKLNEALVAHQQRTAANIHTMARGRRQVRPYQSGEPQRHRFLKVT